MQMNSTHFILAFLLLEEQVHVRGVSEPQSQMLAPAVAHDRAYSDQAAQFIVPTTVTHFVSPHETYAYTTFSPQPVYYTSPPPVMSKSILF